MRTIVLVRPIRVDRRRLTAACHTPSPAMPGLQRFVTAGIFWPLDKVRVSRWCIVRSVSDVVGRRGLWIARGAFDVSGELDELGVAIPFPSSRIPTPAVATAAAIVPLRAE